MRKVEHDLLLPGIQDLKHLSSCNINSCKAVAVNAFCDLNQLFELSDALRSSCEDLLYVELQLVRVYTQLTLILDL